MAEFRAKVNRSHQGTKRCVSHCRQCNISAHNFIVDGANKKFIHGLGVFQDLTCMEIIHSKTGKEIWNVGTSDKKIPVIGGHPLVKEVKRAVDGNLGLA